MIPYNFRRGVAGALGNCGGLESYWSVLVSYSFLTRYSKGAIKGTCSKDWAAGFDSQLCLENVWDPVHISYPQFICL